MVDVFQRIEPFVCGKIKYIFEEHDEATDIWFIN